MFLQTDLHNRRKFLQRSMLGFGSAFVLPSLLAGCKDHLIDPTKPGKPTLPALLGDGSGIDWNDDAKTAVADGLGLIPEVGTFLSDLVNVFWPSSGTNVWGQVQTDLEISNEVYNLVKEDLGSLTPTPTGLVSRVKTYQDAIKYSTTDLILTAWTNAVGAFQQVQEHFQDTNNQVALLPLFAQFANLYLALLRDGVVYGQSWGRTPLDHTNTDVPALTKTVTTFVSYATNTYNAGRANISNNTPEDWIEVEPFRSTNAYDRQMTLTVLDYMDSWPYYDVTIYPKGANNPDETPIPLFTREIYSDPIGNLQKIKSNPYPSIVLPSPATQFPTEITVWGGDRIDAVQLTYPAGGGPNGLTTTPRMGDINGGSTQGPHGGTVGISSDLPIIAAYVTYEKRDVLVDGGAWTLHDVASIDTIQFIFSNGSGFVPFGGTKGPIQPGAIGYDKYALSSIYIHGTADSYPTTSVDCIVFGFMRRPQ